MVSDRAESSRGTVRFEGRSYTLDDYGFLDPPDQWDETFARGIAAELGIHTGLTDEHWKVVRYIRAKFLDEESVPLVVIACMDNGLKLSRMRHLFPTGYHRGACRIAGINFSFLSADNFWHAVETYRTPMSNYRVTELGFLEEFDDWDERFAWLVGREWGLEESLSERRREVLLHLRARYAELGTIPTVYDTCKATSMTLEELRELFPRGYRRGACRMAGLPLHPGTQS